MGVKQDIEHRAWAPSRVDHPHSIRWSNTAADKPRPPFGSVYRPERRRIVTHPGVDEFQRDHQLIVDDFDLLDLAKPDVDRQLLELLGVDALSAFFNCFANIRHLRSS